MSGETSRLTPRWSSLITRPFALPVFGVIAFVPASIAELPGRSAKVRVAPPFHARGPRSGSAVMITAGESALPAISGLRMTQYVTTAFGVS